MLKKYLKGLIIFSLILYILFLTIFLCITLISKLKNDTSLFGYNFLLVGSNSMQPSISNGDLLIIQNTPFQVGDVICYKIGSYLIAHRVVEINENTITTKGDNLEITETITNNQVIGKVIAIISNATIYINIFIFCSLALIFIYLIYFFITHKRKKQNNALPFQNIKTSKLDYKKFIHKK